MENKYSLPEDLGSDFESPEIFSIKIGGKECDLTNTDRTHGSDVGCCPCENHETCDCDEKGFLRTLFCPCEDKCSYCPCDHGNRYSMVLLPL